MSFRWLPASIATLAGLAVWCLILTMQGEVWPWPRARGLVQRLKIASGEDKGSSGSPVRQHLTGFLAQRKQSVLLLAAGLGMGLVAGRPSLALVGAGFGLAVGTRLERLQVDRAVSVFARQLEQAVLLLAAALSANQALVQALRAVAQGVAQPVGLLFRSVLEENSAGRPLHECLGAAAVKANHRDFTYLVQALEVQRHTGGDLIGVLSHTAATVRERRLLRGEMEAKVAEARLTADVLTLSTLGLASYFLVFHPETLRPLYETTTGKMAVLYAIVSWVAGVWVMGRLLKIQDLEDAG